MEILSENHFLSMMTKKKKKKRMESKKSAFTRGRDSISKNDIHKIENNKNDSNHGLYPFFFSLIFSSPLGIHVRRFPAFDRSRKAMAFNVHNVFSPFMMHTFGSLGQLHFQSKMVSWNPPAKSMLLSNFEKSIMIPECCTLTVTVLVDHN